MNKSYSFNLPTRQSYVAIIIIIYRFYKTLVKQLWPVLLIFLVGGNLSKNKDIIIGIGVLAFLTTIYGIIAFFRYYFYVNEGELIIEKGVIRKSKTSIPLDRVQSVDFEQNLIHRLFNVVKLRIDTAGSSGKELELNALDLNQANAFRELILEYKLEQKELVQHQETEELDSDEKNIQLELQNPQPSLSKKILSIDILSLLKVGISANHFKSAWLVIFFFFWLYENLEDAGIELEEYKDYVPDESIVLQSIAFMISLLVLFVIISFLISLIRTVLRYFNLQFIREEGRFKITSGLINRREVAALDNKVQIVQWSQNVLQKGLSLFELSLKQASSVEQRVKNNILVPGIQSQQIDTVTDYLFNEEQEPFLDIQGVHRAYFYRNTLYASLVLVPIIGVTFYFGFYKASFLALFLLLYQVINFFLESKKFGVSLNDHQIKVYGGSFGSKVSLFSLHKIQALKMRQSIYQRRKNLVDLTIMTAGGSVRIPYLHKEKANQISNFCLYKVETSKKKWM